jgi:hypothetical protein
MEDEIIFCGNCQGHDDDPVHWFYYNNRCEADECHPGTPCSDTSHPPVTTLDEAIARLRSMHKTAERRVPSTAHAIEMVLARVAALTPQSTYGFADAAEELREGTPHHAVPGNAADWRNAVADWLERVAALDAAPAETTSERRDGPGRASGEAPPVGSC